MKKKSKNPLLKYNIKIDPLHFPLTFTDPSKSVWEILVDIKSNSEGKPFGFDVDLINREMCIWGLDSDIKELSDTLMVIEWQDVQFAERFFSEITQTDYIRFILKYDTMDKLREIINYRRKCRGEEQLDE